MSKRQIYIYANEKEDSGKIFAELKNKLAKEDFEILETFENTAELVVCIGGDGTFLRLMKSLDYPKVPLLGINTGHTGFFQEFEENEVERLVEVIKGKHYEVQNHNLLVAEVYSDGRIIETHKSVNDIAVRTHLSKLTHLDVSTDNNFIEHFSGDGIVISTPVGSTAYNYALGGGIVDPKMNLLQLCPIAPMDTKAYRSFTSSLLFPPETLITLAPDKNFGQRAMLCLDGFEYDYEKIDEIRVFLSDQVIHVARTEHFNFWEKVTSKFL